MSRDDLTALLPCADIDICAASPLNLAFIGDAVYELIVREHLLSLGTVKVRENHARCVALVNASHQALAASRLQPYLTEDEQNIYRRGRNAHSSHTPRGKSEAEYHAATGFEALCGYLYLSGKLARLMELFNKISVFDYSEE